MMIAFVAVVAAVVAVVVVVLLLQMRKFFPMIFSFSTDIWRKDGPISHMSGKRGDDRGQ